MTYRPLPSCVTIKDSDIQGLGLFATEDIPAETTLGLSHCKIQDAIFRTPLGAFYNHSDEPNCIKIEASPNNFFLKTIKDIKAGEELTCIYTFYSIGE